jgi:hypothetical protein
MARTGPYAAAQLWKLDSVHGRYFDLTGHIAPFLGDPTELVPEEWLHVYRFLNRFTPPQVFIGWQEARFRVFVEEVRGTRILALYRPRAHPDHDTLGIIRSNGTRNGYYHVQIMAEPRIDFMDDWRAQHGSYWPMVLVNGVAVIHPGLEGLFDRSLVVAREWNQLNDWHRERRTRRAHRAVRAPIPWAMEGRARDELGRPVEDSE